MIDELEISETNAQMHEQILHSRMRVRMESSNVEQLT